MIAVNVVVPEIIKDCICPLENIIKMNVSVIFKLNLKLQFTLNPTYSPRNVCNVSNEIYIKCRKISLRFDNLLSEEENNHFHLF